MIRLSRCVWNNCAICISYWLWFIMNPNTRLKIVHILDMIFVQSQFISGVNTMPNSGRTRMVLSFLWFSVIVILTSYSGTLISYLAVDVKSLPFTYLKQVIRSPSYDIWMDTESVYAEIFHVRIYIYLFSHLGLALLKCLVLYMHTYIHPYPIWNRELSTVGFTLWHQYPTNLFCTNMTPHRASINQNIIIQKCIEHINGKRYRNYQENDNSNEPRAYLLSFGRYTHFHDGIMCYLRWPLSVHKKQSMIHRYTRVYM